MVLLGCKIIYKNFNKKETEKNPLVALKVIPCQCWKGFYFTVVI